MQQNENEKEEPMKEEEVSPDKIPVSEKPKSDSSLKKLTINVKDSVSQTMQDFMDQIKTSSDLGVSSTKEMRKSASPIPSPNSPPPGWSPPSPNSPPPGWSPPSPNSPPPGWSPPSPNSPPPGWVPPLSEKEDPVLLIKPSTKKEMIDMQNDKAATPASVLKKTLALFYGNQPYVHTSQNHEVEVKFGQQLTRIDYDNVIKKLKSLGFESQPTGNYFLRIYSDFLDPRTGTFKSSRTMRTEINSLHSIQMFCKTNDIKTLIDKDAHRHSVRIVDKSPIVLEQKADGSKTFLRDAYFSDFKFSVSYRTERTLPFTNPRAITMVNDWTKSKKAFRYLNRVAFVHPDFPVQVDMGIVKSSKKAKDSKDFVKTYSMAESHVFENSETYDIELEVMNSRIGPGTAFDNEAKIEDALRKVIKYVLSGLQQTNFPISAKEQEAVLRDYMATIHHMDESEKQFKEQGRRVYTSDFIGPQSYTLQMENIAPLDQESSAPNIRRNYLVTEKADGDRCLLFVSEKGRLYFINTNMRVMFTGTFTENPVYFNTLLDGELVLHNKKGDFINLYTAFDLYFVNKVDKRALGFLPTSAAGSEEEQKVGHPTGSNGRYALLKTAIQGLQIKSIVPDAMVPLRIAAKEFYPMQLNNSEPMSIFNASSYINKKIEDGLYEYNTDGLIYTPAFLGVGSDSVGKAGPLQKVTWDHSFKWKPAEYNTIDFLVSTLKAPNGEDYMQPLFEDGVATMGSGIKQYKTLVLQVGFDERKHGYMNPCQDVLEDRIPDATNMAEESGPSSSTYKRQRFYPTDPYDPNAGITKIALEPDTRGSNQMKTEEDEVFEDMTIVEFRYDMTRPDGWRWVPLRVRYDKTTELKQSLLGNGKPNYGNAYHVADSNWKSIHKPITLKMITTGQDIPSELETDSGGGVYYNRATMTTNATQGLRDFHNLFVKRRLILGVSRREDTLIDLACGKGGDFPKWIAAGLSFVFGLDIAKDNLENRVDGACARFLNYRKKYKKMPYALFVNGDVRNNIRDGTALLSDKAIQVTKAVFGEGAKNDTLGAGVLRQYGKGLEGFRVTSCQFALHYFMESPRVFREFMRNLAEVTALDGYFIATCYDGKKIFQMLKNKQKGESVEVYDQAKVKLCEIRKDYEGEEFNDDISSLGYKINVWQQSINKMAAEFLVNHEYFVRVMEDFGFLLVTRDDAKKMGLPDGTGFFSDLYAVMMNDRRSKTEYGVATSMNEYEKKISFWNRYYVFKKVRQVNAAKVPLEEEGEEGEEGEEEQAKEPAKEPVKKVKETGTIVKAKVEKPKRLGKKLIIIDEEAEPEVLQEEEPTPLEQLIQESAPQTELKITQKRRSTSQKATKEPKTKEPKTNEKTA